MLSSAAPSFVQASARAAMVGIEGSLKHAWTAHCSSVSLVIGTSSLTAIIICAIVSSASALCSLICSTSRMSGSFAAPRASEDV